MWKDNNDEIDSIFTNFEQQKEFPVICPICKKDSAHIYMHIHNENTRRGGLWIWCSECHTFSHSSIYVLGYWKNCLLVDVEELNSIPIYLDGIKNIVDKHANDILRSILE